MNRISHLSIQRPSVSTQGHGQILDRSNDLIGSRHAGAAQSCLMCAFAFILLVGQSPAVAQGPNNKPGNKNTKTPDKKPKVVQPPADDLDINPEKLPPGYKPPAERLAIMDLEKPLASKDDLEKLKKDSVGKFFKARNDCDLSPAGRKIVQDSVKYGLWVMTLKDVPGKPAKDAPIPQVTQLPQLHKRFVDEVLNFGGNPAVRPADKAAFADFLGKEVCKQIPELLTNNFYVRLHAVMILGEIDYSGAYELLLQVLQAKDISVDPVMGQPDAVKIAAANSLIRVLRFARPAPEVKIRTIIAHALISELKEPDTHFWLQMRLIEGLRYCEISGVDAGDNGKPFVVSALLEIVKDQKRPWTVRMKACYALGRVPLPPGVKAEDVVAIVAECASEMATAAAAEPKKIDWKSCFWDLYTTFVPRDAKDLDSEGKNPGGLMSRAKNAAKPVYELIVPLVNDVINNKAPDPANRQKLEAFTKRPQMKGATNGKETETVTQKQNETKK